ncbi:MAG TPA: hypothetical protein VK906_13360, partial [Egicoccus sp.]
GEGSRMMSFDPTLRRWAARHAPPFAVDDPASTALLWDGRQVVLVGNAPPDNDADAGTVQGRLATFDPATEQWQLLPDWPKRQVADVAVIGDLLVAVDDRHRVASFDFDARSWSGSVPTGIVSECSSQLAADGDRLLLVGCHFAARSGDAGRTWEQFEVDGVLHHPAVLADGTVLVWRGADGAAELLAMDLVERGVAPVASAPCGDVTAFGARLGDTGITADEAAPDTPSELAQDVDLVVGGTLTGEVEVANGPGPAGESYLAYELQVTDVIAGDAAVGDTVRVSIAFDGEPLRSAELSRDVPVGASALVFAYEVTDAPGGWVAADGNGFAVACEGGPPLGQVGDGPGWSGLADLDALIDAAG